MRSPALLSFQASDPERRSAPAPQLFPFFLAGNGVNVVPIANILLRSRIHSD